MHGKMSTQSDGTMAQPDDFWVFAYGSLLWNPGFPHEESIPARLIGHHRTLCIYSHRYRGTPERPGLVLGLDRGGSCAGLAYRVDARDAAAVRAYLREREMVTGVYLEGFRPVRLAGGRRVDAWTYVADRNHTQYAGRLGREERLALIRNGAGQMGPNAEYVLFTVQRLRDLGFRDSELEWYAAALSGEHGA